MGIEVFNRFENKYILDSKKFDKFENRLTEYMELDEFNKTNDIYSITNLYYDTADNHLIRTSLSKPTYKEKLRLRAYGASDSNSMVYVEIKKKVNGLTNKRRSEMKLHEAYAFLETGVIPKLKPYMNSQVMCEVEYMLKQHRLLPAVYLTYDRRAYFGRGQHDLRVSFDCNIRSRRSDLRLDSGNFGKLLLAEDMWLMEIKSAQSIPFWLTQLLSEFEIYPAKFSKYGVAHIRQLQSSRTKGLIESENLPIQMPSRELVSA